MTYSISDKRKLLTSALFQHSSKTQTFKQTALERITERIIYFSLSKELTAGEIQSIFKDELNYNLPLTSFSKALDNLIENGKVEKVDENRKFKLSQESHNEFKLIEKNTDKSYLRLTNKLFHTPPDNKDKYIEPFWVSMNYIFSSVGEFSAKLVNGSADRDIILRPILENCMTEIRSNYKINYDYFFKQIKNFFENTTEPLFNEFRWVLAQNYFITSSLGINPESEPFSKELFKETTIYLDTNIILSLISKNNKHFNNAFSFIKAANKLEINFCLCQITIEEYERYVNSEAENIVLAVDQIPKNTKSKIGSVIYQDLQFELKGKGEITKEERQEVLDQVIANYLDFKTLLEQLIPNEKLTYIDDSWFDSIEKNKVYETTVTIVKEKFLDLRKRKKSNNACAHDSKILLWIDKEIKENGNSTWLVTSDYSLPLIKIKEQEKSTSIILEAILQWLVPLTNNDFKETFSQTLKQKILPQEFLFDVNDFVIFEELHMECGELPSEDIEECILFLKKNAPNLNPNSSKDREKLAAFIAKYFFDPGRKYKSELSEREKENEGLKNELDDMMSSFNKLESNITLKSEELEISKKVHKKEVEDIKNDNIEKIKKLKTSFEESKNESDGEIKKLKNSYEEIQNELRTIKEEKQQEKEEKKAVNVAKSFKKWECSGKYALVVCILLIIFIILEFLPNWSFNYPAKILNAINDLQKTDNARYRILINLNNYFITTVVIVLFLFAYNRLFNKEKRRDKTKELNKKLK